MEFTEPVMRPPQESSSLILRITQGCTYNKCNFCYISRGFNFMAITPEELEWQAAAVATAFPSWTPIYLAGSNPFVLPAWKLEQYINVLRKYFPDFSRLSMQARIDDIARKTGSDLQKLRSLGLSHLYIGTENGHEAVLAMMNKGHTAADTVVQLKRLDDARITYTTFYVLGLGGKGYGVASGIATAEMFNQVNPIRITTTGMTLFPDAPVAQMARNGQYQEAGEREKIEELKAFLENLHTDAFYDGIHYLNPLNYRFHNGDASAKKKVLADIDDILNTYTDEELELMVNRKLMVSL